MLKYLPLIVVCIALVPLTIWQWSMMDWVWTSNVPAQQCAYLLQTEIPDRIGDWVGIDQPVTEEVRKTAGADGYISRTYVNETSPEKRVTVWFIVGHFRNVARHTPNVCYRGAGFDQVEKAIIMEMPPVEGLPDSEFRTAKFRGAPGGQVVFERVFWAWWKPEPLAEGQSPEDVQIAWTSPEDPRLQYGFCRALYKLYFTARSDEDETPSESVCLEFAQEFLPVVDAELRNSGLVMKNEELPEDHEAVFEQMLEANEKGQEEKAADTSDAAEESSEEQPADETAEAA